jgi:hypothetical protein
MADIFGRRRKPFEPAEGATTVKVDVAAVGREGGDYQFRFSGSEFVEPNGDLDFRKIPTAVEIFFVLTKESERGFRFATPAENAIAVVLAERGQRGKCPSSGAEKNDQFIGFALNRDRSILRVVDRNSDRQTYLYALNFTNAKGCGVVLDPKVQNGGSGGGGGN